MQDAERLFVASRESDSLRVRDAVSFREADSFRDVSYAGCKERSIL